MNTCWQILEIEPTTNLDAIKDARRTLIKHWHPDTVKDATLKLEYTTRCAAINAAFDEASGFAKAWTPVIAPSPGASENRRRRPRSGGPLTDFAIRGSYIVTMGFSIMFLSVMSRPARRAMGFLIPFALCIFIAGFVNSMLLKYALRPRLSGLKGSKTAAWIVLSAANIIVLAAGLSDVGGQLFGTLGGAVFDAAVGLVIPVYVSTRPTYTI